MKFGYARVSTPEQSLENQIANLKNAGAEKIFSDKTSGMKDRRPGFDKMEEQLRPGDKVIITTLCRLGRSTRNLLRLLDEWHLRDIHMLILDLQIDTSTPIGRMAFTFTAAMKECERNLTSEKTKFGLMGARSRGRKGGRPKKLDETKVKRMIQIYKENRLSIKEILIMYNISKTTLYEYLHKHNVVWGKK